MILWPLPQITLFRVTRWAKVIVCPRTSPMTESTVWPRSVFLSWELKGCGNTISLSLRRWKPSPGTTTDGLDVVLLATEKPHCFRNSSYTFIDRGSSVSSVCIKVSASDQGFRSFWSRMIMYCKDGSVGWGVCWVVSTLFFYFQGSCFLDIRFSFRVVLVLVR